MCVRLSPPDAKHYSRLIFIEGGNYSTLKISICSEQYEFIPPPLPKARTHSHTKHANKTNAPLYRTTVPARALQLLMWLLMWLTTHSFHILHGGEHDEPGPGLPSCKTGVLTTPASGQDRSQRGTPTASMNPNQTIDVRRRD